MYYDRLTRLLHLLFATGIVAQLLLSLVMVHPKPGRAGDGFYELHESLGLVVLGVLVVYWIWGLVRSGNREFGQLFPWFSGARYRAIWEDGRRYAAHAMQWRLPEESQPSPLPGAVQGLGLLGATALGVSGVILELFMAENGSMVGWVHAVKEGHEVFGSLMWAYLVAHVLMGGLHQLAGHGSLGAMVCFWKKYPQADMKPQG